MCIRRTHARILFLVCLGLDGSFEAFRGNATRLYGEYLTVYAVSQVIAFEMMHHARKKKVLR